jgi:hypothetical protein
MPDAGKIHLTNEQIDVDWVTRIRGVEEAPITQATHLPEGPINRPIVDEKLTRETNWIDWEQSVKGIPSTNFFERLVDKTIPRPRPTTEMGERWRMKSRLVGDWLLSSISMPLLQNINLGHKDAIFADDIWKTLVAMCKGQRIFSDAKAWTTFTGMRDSDYDNIGDYTVAYSQAYNMTKEAGFGIPGKGLIIGYLVGMAVFNAQVADDFMQYLNDANHQKAASNEQLFEDAIFNVRLYMRYSEMYAESCENLQSSVIRKRRCDDATDNHVSDC